MLLTSRQPIVVVTCGQAIPAAVEMAHRAAVLKSLPAWWDCEYVSIDNHWWVIQTILDREADSPNPRPVVFQDVDCLVPHRAYLRAQADASLSDGLVGIAQAANHIDPSRLYAGPAFLWVDPVVWHLCHRPSPRPGPSHDVAQRITEEWSEAPVLYRPMSWNPSGPVWLAGKDKFGWDTTYENGVFHAFCIRDGGDREKQFLARCAEWQDDRSN